MNLRNVFKFCSSQMAKLTNYELLEVHHSCSQRQIKHNYLRLAKIYHPDVYKGKDVERFKSIQEAYQILKSPERRRAYDETQKIHRSNKTQDPSQEGEKVDEEKSEQEEEQKDQSMFKFRDYKSKSAGTRPEDYMEEYDKFMKKPMETDPGNIWIYENIFMRQQTKVYKEQLQYMYTKAHPYENFIKRGHVQGYNKQVQDFIESKNTYEEQKRQVTPEKVEKRVTRNNKWKKYLAFGIFAICMPFIQSGLDRRFKVNRQMKDDLKQKQEEVEESQVTETQSRFVY